MRISYNFGIRATETPLSAWEESSEPPALPLSPGGTVASTACIDKTHKLFWGKIPRRLFVKYSVEVTEIYLSACQRTRTMTAVTW
jgi:hypothetical protein